MENLSVAASIIGYCVIVALAAAAILAALLAAIRYCPVRFDWKRNLPSQIKTPSGVFNIDGIYGISGRWGFNWTFGLMLVSEGKEPRVTSKKTDPLPASQ